MDLRIALSTNATTEALAIASMAVREPDFRAEKIVSTKYRYLWICNPKVASRSLIAALTEADPSALLIRDATIEEVYATYPQVRDYYSFAFVRHPYQRALSFYAEKYLAISDLKRRYFIQPYYGVSEHSSFDDICRWFNTPYGSDAFADRPWLSQYLQIRLRRRRLPDFIGHYENLQSDLNALTAHLGVRIRELPLLNATAGDHPQQESLEREMTDRAKHLTDRCKALLQKRYAKDFELGGYAK